MYQIDLSTFVGAQQRDYGTAYKEISNGRKVSHWMWYIFPQIYGLGRSSISEYYAIKSVEEAKAFLEDSYLGGNLRSICNALLKVSTNNATEVFGRPDDMKLRSCMTLFSFVSNGESVFNEVLAKFFSGKQDFRTIKILQEIKN